VKSYQPELSREYYLSTIFLQIT